MNYLIVGIGAFGGGVFRYFLGNVFNHKNKDYPLGTLYANVIGSILIGIFAALLRNNVINSTGNDFFAAGFCGGLTTFSTFSSETLTLFLKNRINVALFYWLSTLMASIISVYMGYLIISKII